MNYARKEFILEEARQLLIKLWKKRAQIWSNPPDLEDLFPLPVDIIIKNILGIQYEEPVEIPSLASLRQEIVTTETVGFMDRVRNRIVVAQNIKNEWRRFTAAHEIGHWILHPSIKSHRDRPITGAERATLLRDPEEQEADLFAAELLMPRKVLRKYFIQHFGEMIDGRQPNEDLTVWLSAGTGESIDMIELAKRGARYRALLISKASTYKGRRLISLADRFGVSHTAMAIQLEELGLVK
ncbi:MAG TPA: ImmA/IrrE family metallo-endopeptidase [Nitrososphaera sp.]|nr:ImmA/IrrE family metallo-endopeptidase [Nitrososphaera sp.]